MKKFSLSIMAVFIICFIFSIFYTYADVPKLSANVKEICNTDDGEAIALIDDTKQSNIIKIGNDSFINYQYKTNDKKDDKSNILDIAYYNNKIYAIEAVYHKFLLKEQKLICIDPSKNDDAEVLLSFNEEENGIISSLNISDDKLFVSAISKDNKTAMVNKYVFASDGTPVSTETLTYESIDNEDFSEIEYFDSIAFVMSKKGNIYKIADMQVAKKIFKNAQFFTLDNDLSILIKDQSTGDIYKTNIYSQEYDVIGKGDMQINKTTNTVYSDIVAISYTNEENFTALLKDEINNKIQLVLFKDKNRYDLSNYVLPLSFAIKDSIVTLLISFGAGLAVILLIFISNKILKTSKNFNVKLVYSTGIVIVIAFVIIGGVIYNTYSISVSDTVYEDADQINNYLMNDIDKSAFSQIDSQASYSTQPVKELTEIFGNNNITNTVIDGNVVESSLLFVKDNMVYTGIDKSTSFYNSLDNYYSISEISDINKAINQKSTVNCKFLGTYGEKITSITPLIVDEKVTALLITGIYNNNMNDKISDFMRFYVKFGICFVVILIIIISIINQKLLKPLRDIESSAAIFSNSNQAVPIKYSTVDEFFNIGVVFNNMTSSIESQIYTLNSMSDAYCKFFSKKMITILGKKSIVDLELGSSVKLKYPIANIKLHNIKEIISSYDEKKSMKFINKFFSYVNMISIKYDAILNINDKNLSDISLIFTGEEKDALSASLDIIELIRSNNIEHSDEQMNISVMLHSYEVLFGIGGDFNRYAPVLISPDFEFVDNVIEQSKSFDCSLMVTQNVFDKITDKAKYHYRKVGFAKYLDKEIDLYDFYDCSSKELINFKESTKELFEQAISLFYDNNFYLAKSNFAAVVKQNPFDYIAKMYLFKCDRIEKQTNTDKLDLSIF